MYPNTQNLIISIIKDEFPTFATCVDFGIDKENAQQVFGAYQWAYRNDTVTEYELDENLGNGPALTKIVNRGQNPYACEIVTAWDDLPEEEELEEILQKEHKQWIKENTWTCECGCFTDNDETMCCYCEKQRDKENEE